MAPDANGEKVYLYAKPMEFRKSIDGLSALVELDIKAAVFDPVLRLPQQTPQSRKGIVLGMQRLLSSAEAP